MSSNLVIEKEVSEQEEENAVRTYNLLIEQARLYREQARARGLLKDVPKRFSEIENFILKFYSRHSGEYESLIRNYHFEEEKDKMRVIQKVSNEKQFIFGTDVMKETEKLKELLRVMKERKALYALRVLRDRIDGANTLLTHMKNSGKNYGDYLRSQKKILPYGLHPLLSQGSQVNGKKGKRKILRDFLEEKNLLPEDYRKLRRAISKAGDILGIPLKNHVLMGKGFSYDDLNEQERQNIYKSYTLAERESNEFFFPNERFSKKEFARIFGLRNVRTLNKILEDYLRDYDDLDNTEKERLLNSFRDFKGSRTGFIRHHGLSKDTLDRILEKDISANEPVLSIPTAEIVASS